MRRDGDEQYRIAADDEREAVEPCVTYSSARSKKPLALHESSQDNDAYTERRAKRKESKGRTNRIHRMRRQLENPIEHQIPPLKETVAPVPAIIFDDVVRFGFDPEVEGDEGCADDPSVFILFCGEEEERIGGMLDRDWG